MCGPKRGTACGARLQRGRAHGGRVGSGARGGAPDPVWCAHHGRSLEDVKSPGGSPRRHLGTEEHEPARTPPPPRLPAVRPAHARQGRRDHHPPLVRAGTLRPPGRPVRQPAHSALTRPLRVFQPRRPNQQNPATGNPTRIQLPNGTPRPAQTLRRISRTQTLNVPPQRRSEQRITL